MIKRLGIMQPYFMPYIGYFSLIKHVDQFILLDDVQFIRHGWIERNRMLKQTGDWQYVSVPLMKHNQKTRIKEIMINNQTLWKKKIFDQLVHYRKAPFYWRVIGLIEEVLCDDIHDITHLNQVCLKGVCEYLEIQTPIDIFSEMRLNIGPVNSADEWALSICKAIPDVTEYWNPPGGKNLFDIGKYNRNGIDIKFQQVEILEYDQMKGSFMPGLSILDVMMFNDKERINEMLDRFYFI